MLRRPYFPYSRFPFPAHPALRLPLLFPRPRFRLPPRPLPFRRLDHAGILPFYHAGRLPQPLPVPYARAPTMPSRNNRSLKVVKKPFKPSRNQKAPTRFPGKGRGLKILSEVSKMFMNNKVDSARHGLSPLDLVEEVRALHALWRAGSTNTDADFGEPGPALAFVPQGRTQPENPGSVLDRQADLLAETRALHELWRTGNAEAFPKGKPGPLMGGKRAKNVPAAGRKGKVKAHLDPGKASNRTQRLFGEGSVKKRKQRNKKSARASLRELNEPAQINVNANTSMPPFSHSVDPDDIPADDAHNTSLTRDSDVALMANKDTKHDVFTPGTQGEESSNFGGVKVEQETPPPRKRGLFDVPEEIEKDLCERVIAFFNSVDGEVESEELSPDEEKEREDESFHFFSDLFRENSLLRSVYARDGSGRTIDCLVCHSLGERKGFDKILSLVMHSTSRVKRRPEHRGYGRAVSAIVGWNSNRA